MNEKQLHDERLQLAQQLVVKYEQLLPISSSQEITHHIQKAIDFARLLVEAYRAGCSDVLQSNDALVLKLVAELGLEFHRTQIEQLI